MKCICDPLTMNGSPFNQFIAEYFNTCAYSTADIVAFAFGIINIICWMFAQMPQPVESYQNKTCGNLSWSFLAIWLLGDITNLVGSIFTNQSTILVYTAVYFTLMDIVVLGQTVYYETCYKSNQRRHDTPLSSPASDYNTITLNISEGTPLLAKAAYVPVVIVSIIALTQFDLASASPIDLITSTSTPPDDVIPIIPYCNSHGVQSALYRWAGTISAWICGILYFTARIPQIIVIHKEKSAYGVSFALFAISFAANLFYGISILLPDTTDVYSSDFFWNTVPFLIGSLGANV